MPGGRAALACCLLRSWPSRTVRALCADELVQFGQGKRPREGVDLFAAGAGRVRLELPGPEQDTNALGAQLGDAVLEWRPARQGGVHERQDDNRDAQAGSFGEDPEGVGVADPVGPFVDRVVGGRGADDRLIRKSAPGWAPISD